MKMLFDSIKKNYQSMCFDLMARAASAAAQNEVLIKKKDWAK